MAETLPPLVIPISGERYAALDRLSDLIAPPYDVISPAERAALAGKNPQNIVHVMLPEANGDRYQAAAAMLDQWRRSGALVRESEPAMYVFRQEFSTPSGSRHGRTGVFGALSAEPYSTRRVRPHEHTHAGPKADRLALIEATRTTIESIFVLAPDRKGDLVRLLAGITSQAPLARAKLGEVTLTIWKATGAAGQKIAEAAGSDALYIADGHHRFETAGAYRAKNPKADRTIALIVPLGDPGLVVLPTHRLIRQGVVNEQEALDLLERQFEIEPVESEMDCTALLANRGKDMTAALLALPGGKVFSLVIRETALANEKGVASRLDVARIDGMVVGPLAKLAGTGAKVDYTPDPAAVFSQVADGRAAAGVLLNPTRVKDVLAVADAGEVMPPKSTYFIPKVPSGLLLLPHPAP